MAEQFIFMKRFVEIGETLPEDFRSKFYLAVVDYKTRGIKPEDPIISALFISLGDLLDYKKRGPSFGSKNNPHGKNGKDNG